MIKLECVKQNKQNLEVDMMNSAYLIFIFNTIFLKEYLFQIQIFFEKLKIKRYVNINFKFKLLFIKTPKHFISKLLIKPIFYSLKN